MLFHVLNRGVGRMQIFRTEADFDAFQRVIEETLRGDVLRGRFKGSGVFDSMVCGDLPQFDCESNGT